MEKNRVDLVECFYPHTFLDGTDHTSLLLILWQRTKYRKENIPQLYFRYGYYLVDDRVETQTETSIFFVGVSELKPVRKLYFFPTVLEDFPVIHIDLEINDYRKRISYVEIYNLGEKKSIHYVVPRKTKYCNPFDDSEQVYSEIIIDEEVFVEEEPTNTIGDQFREQGETGLEEFAHFMDVISQRSNVKPLHDNSHTSSTTKTVDVKSEKHPLFVTKFRRQNTGEHTHESIGIVWLNEKHWKKTYKYIGFCSKDTAPPVFMLPLIEYYVRLIGNIYVSDMLKSLKLSSTPRHVKKIFINDDVKWHIPNIAVQSEKAVLFCLTDVMNALFSRRDMVDILSCKIDFGDRFGLISHHNILDPGRTHLDPCDPFNDSVAAMAFCISNGCKYKNYLSSTGADLFDSGGNAVGKDGVNTVRLRIIAGEILSLTRNGKTHGTADQNRPIPSVHRLNSTIEKFCQLAEHFESEGQPGALDMIQHLRKDEERYLKDFTQGLNEIETILYLINGEAFVLSPLLPRDKCLRGTWCKMNTANNVSLIHHQGKFPRLCDRFYNYDNFYEPLETILDYVN